jgi:uncharacterized surface protein with fasciclin (FAS1) repeats
VKRFHFLGLAALSAALIQAPLVASAASTMAAKPGTIVEVAAANGNFTTLVAAVKAAGLVDTLNSAGPFTVFAPTDAAFAKLPKGTLEALLKPENKEQLKAILLYHVVPGRVPSSAVATGEVATADAGKTLKLTAESGKVMVNDATVTTADVAASNGVIHVIDVVLIPSN